MDRRLKKPLVSNFKAAGPQMACLSPAIAAIILNTSAIIGIPQGLRSAEGKQVNRRISIECENSQIF